MPVHHKYEETTAYAEINAEANLKIVIWKYGRCDFQDFDAPQKIAVLSH
ncbi:hypothetical protein [Scopulibacillus daqui]|nr:hypothetical protein [Scopulibacillus daqui]